MAKRPRKWNQDVHKGYIKGRWQGTSGLHTLDPNSRLFPPRYGIADTWHDYRASASPDVQFGDRFFHMLDWSVQVPDIREQSPLLDVQVAMKLTRQSGMRYPEDNVSSSLFVVMTTDFLVSRPAGAVAWSVKPSKELECVQTLEQLEIKRKYWTKN